MSGETTAIYWEASGLPLNNLAWSVKTLGGDRNSPAEPRGDNVKLPFKKGSLWVRKMKEAKSLTLPMWMDPFNTDGSVDLALTMEQKFHANWKTLLDAFDTGGQFDLKKRWWSGNTIKDATARAELIGGMEPTISGNQYHAEFNVDLELADPYFYKAVASQALGAAVTIIGDVPTDHVVLTLTSGTNPRVTFPGGNWIQFNGVIGGTPVVIDLSKCTAKIGSVFVNGSISRNSQFIEWPYLAPGAQTLVLSTGAGTFTYDAAYR